MKTAYIFFAEGFEEIEAITIVDVLRRAEIPVTMVSVTNSIVVAGAHNIHVTTECLFEDVDINNAEILILPGGMPGSENLNKHEGLRTMLKDFAEQDKKVAAICAAPMVLGNLDILQGKSAVCYPGFEETLTGAKVVYDPACISENVTTGRGIGGALQFALSIVEQLKDKTQADKLARAMLVADW